MERGEVDQSMSMKDFEEQDQNFENIINLDAIHHSPLNLDVPADDEELRGFILEHVGNLTLAEIGVDEQDLIDGQISSQDTVTEFIGKNQIKSSFVSLPWGRIVWFIIRFVTRWAYKRYLKSYLDWFNFMTKDYNRITRELFAEYPEIDIFIHHDMDMDDWYELAPPKLPYEEQVKRVNDLAGRYGGRIVPFFAYNPRKSLDHLKASINHSGNNTDSHYIGVKFYPPSGYQPWYDDQSNDWQIRNLELYTFCVKHDIPVFTHCNYGGMEAGKDYWKNNNVEYWKKVLEKFPSIRLCFGHSGGDAGWLGDFDSKKLKELGHDTFEKSFPGQIYHLCINYKNVYCEFGYLPDIIDLDNRNKFRKRLVQCIEDSVSDKYKFSEKMLYGTDWHMIMQEHGYHDYYESFTKLFMHKSLRPYRDEFFSRNALAYLKMKN